MRNIKLIIKYDGTKYKGWQRLGSTDNTIQGKIESILGKMTGEQIEIIGSGRTDMGVHALGQVANFKTNSQLALSDMRDYLYQYLPEDVVVLRAEEVDNRFHARYNAVGKKYLYKIWNHKYHDPFLRKYVEHVPQKLDLQAMIKATAYVLGEHDFSSFVSAKSKKKSNVRKLFAIDINQEGDMINIMFYGNGFLYNMVRIIVGTLIEVGSGRMKPEYVAEILQKRDRSLAGPTAAARGLYLLAVEY